MRWLVWRQHRWDAAAAFAVLLVFGGATLIVTAASANLISEVDRACAAQSPSCNSLLGEYSNSSEAFRTFVGLGTMFVPALIGFFVGAPMVAREFEQGTHLLVWAQGITRKRWFAVKLMLVSLAAVIGSGLLGAIVEIWLATQASFWANLWDSFDMTPLTLVAYTIFALALGVACGAIIQRTVQAMALTLAIFMAVRFAITQMLRPQYLPPLTADYDGSLNAGDSSPLLVGFPTPYNLAGHQISVARWHDALRQCSSELGSSSITGSPSLHACLLTHGVRAVVQYQPASRFWAFQGIEAVIFLAFAILLIAIAYRLVVKKA